MPDFTFKIDPRDVYHGYAHQACRLAVLGGLGYLRNGVTVPDSYELLQGQWRQRVSLLHKAGWSSADTSTVVGVRNVQYLRNCPPFGVKFMQEARTCNRSRVCPSCWARNVVLENCRAVEWLCLHFPAAMAGLKLVGVRAVTAAAVDACLWDTWRALLSKSVFDDHNAIPGKKVFGTRARISLAPSREAGVMEIVQSTLSLVPSDLKLPEFVKELYGMPRSKASVRTCPLDDREAVCKLIAWNLRYPVGMMTGDARTAAEILHETAKVKLAASAGLLDTDSLRATLRNLTPKNEYDVPEEPL